MLRTGLYVRLRGAHARTLQERHGLLGDEEVWEGSTPRPLPRQLVVLSFFPDIVMTHDVTTTPSVESTLPLLRKSFSFFTESPIGTVPDRNR